MQELRRITRTPGVKGGRPCIRDTRITVETVAELAGAGRTRDEILTAHPELKPEDISEALRYAAWRAGELEIPIGAR
ncbi:MAG: DUF433 domain-containing protein [Armatimonadetes bacterium]|nr:DUF433 domain-containing protein [Armatimonadota bacterium]